MSKQSAIELLAALSEASAAPVADDVSKARLGSGSVAQSDQGSPLGHQGAADPTWIHLVDEARVHLERARQALSRGRSDAAAVNIRKAASFVAAEALFAFATTRARLQRDGRALCSLAEHIAVGVVKAPTDLEGVFNQACLDLARHHRLQAEGAWAREDRWLAAKSLAASAKYARAALALADPTKAVELKRRLAQATRHAGRLEVGEEPGCRSQWSSALAVIDQVIDALSRRTRGVSI